MKILIIGSEGFIGKHSIRYFTEMHYNVTGVDIFEQATSNYNYIKISRLSPEFDEIVKLMSFDVVINCAGSANVPFSMSHPLLDFEANCFDTEKVLESIKRNIPSCKYIHLSSAAVYGNPTALPIKEDDILTPLSIYGWNKLIAENICQKYAHIFNLNIAIVRPFSVYGSGLKKQLFYDLYKKSKLSTPFELFGTGDESRDFIHINDLTKALDIIINKSAFNCNIYNLSSGIETKVKDAVEIFFSCLNQPVSYTYNGITRSGDPLNWRADITEIKKIGFESSIDLKEGLREMTNWLKTLEI